MAPAPRLRLLLWEATRDRTHLAEAHALVEESLRKVSSAHDQGMRENDRVARKILAAWAREAGATKEGSELT